MALYRAYRHLKSKIPTVLARCLAVQNMEAREEATPLRYLSNPSDWLTLWWDAKCQFGWEFIDRCNAEDPEVLKENLLTSLQRAKTSVRCLLDLGIIYGYKGFGDPKTLDLRQILLEYLCQDFLGIMIANFKYHLLFLANKGRHAEAPPRKEEIRNIDGWLIDWRFRQWCLRRLIRDVSFGETLLLGVKRGLPSMDERNVETEVKCLLDDLGKESPATPQFLLEEVSRTAREIFGTQSPKPSKSFQFSDRAGFEVVAGVQKGGIRGVIWRWALEKGYASSELSLYSLKWGPHRGLVAEYRYLISDLYPHIWDGLFRLWIAEQRVTPKRPTKCRLAVIFEPLKVRPITAGESMRYALGKAFQQPLWDSLQRFPCFSFTGCSVNASIVTSQLSKYIGDLSDPLYYRGEFRAPRDVLYVSADYKGATNYMHSDCTQAVLDAIYPDPAWRAIAEDLVGAHDIHYYDRSGLGRERVLLRQVLQKSGQLMGSMISFPILCCVNVAVLRAAYERVLERTLSLKEIPALINGDDLVARMTTVCYDLWQSWIPHVGFFESPGKSYISRSWVQINSRTFDMEEITPIGFVAVRQRPFVNMGIIEGFKKGIEPQHEPVLENVAVRLGTVRKEFADLPPRIRSRAEEVFRVRYQERCKNALKAGAIPYIPSWFNPVELGGLGFGSNLRDLQCSIYEEPVDWKEFQASREWKYLKPTGHEFFSGDLLPADQRWVQTKMKMPRNWSEYESYAELERLKNYLD